jgi:hypothetical protein
MEKFIYLFIKNLLDAEKVDYKHYELFNNQPLNSAIINLYPAIYIEILPIEWDQRTYNIQESTATIRLHIVNEIYSSFDSDDANIDKSLDHLNFLTEVYKALSLKSSDSSNIPQLEEVEEYFNIGSLQRIRTSNITTSKSKYITMMDFESRIIDKSNWTYHNYDEFTLNTISGSTNSSTGLTFEIYGE